jgi:AcrR family transcriptional regulator
MARNVKAPAKTTEPESEQRRTYRSELRTQQALATRRTIRDAAEKLFVAHGYGVSINAIAEEAGVAPETVYATFKNKRALLKELVDVSVAGDDEPVAVNARAWLDDVLAEPDQRRAMRMINEAGFTRVARAGAVTEVLRSAASSDPQLQEVWDAQQAGRHHDIAQFVDILAERGPLRVDRETAIDVVWAIGGSEVWRALVVDRGWSVERYIAVMDDLLQRFGLPDES